MEGKDCARGGGGLLIRNFFGLGSDGDLDNSNVEWVGGIVAIVAGESVFNSDARCIKSRVKGVRVLLVSVCPRVLNSIGDCLLVGDLFAQGVDMVVNVVCGSGEERGAGRHEGSLKSEWLGVLSVLILTEREAYGKPGEGIHWVLVNWTVFVVGFGGGLLCGDANSR